jgi:hypothetical protein
LILQQVPVGSSTGTYYSNQLFSGSNSSTYRVISEFLGPNKHFFLFWNDQHWLILPGIINLDRIMTANSGIRILFFVTLFIYHINKKFFYYIRNKKTKKFSMNCFYRYLSLLYITLYYYFILQIVLPFGTSFESFKFFETLKLKKKKTKTQISRHLVIIKRRIIARWNRLDEARQMMARSCF